MFSSHCGSILHRGHSRSSKLVPFDSLSISVEYTVFEIFAFENYRDLETQVSGNLRSLEMTVFDRPLMTSYSHFIVTLALACTVSEIHNYYPARRLQEHRAVYMRTARL